MSFSTGELLSCHGFLRPRPIVGLWQTPIDDAVCTESTGVVVERNLVLVVATGNPWQGMFVLSSPGNTGWMAPDECLQAAV